MPQKPAFYRFSVPTGSRQACVTLWSTGVWWQNKTVVARMGLILKYLNSFWFHDLFIIRKTKYTQQKTCNSHKWLLLVCTAVTGSYRELQDQLQVFGFFCRNSTAQVSCSGYRELQVFFSRYRELQEKLQGVTGFCRRRKISTVQVFGHLQLVVWWFSSF